MNGARLACFSHERWWFLVDFHGFMKYLDSQTDPITILEDGWQWDMIWELIRVYKLEATAHDR